MATPAQIIQEVRARRLVVEMGQARRLRRPQRVPRPLEPSGATLRYRQALNALVLEMIEIIQADVLTALAEVEAEATVLRQESRLDQVDETIERVIEGVRVQFAEKFSDDRIRSQVGERGTDVIEFNKREGNRQFRRVIGVDLAVDPEIGAQLAAWTRENVTLIKSIPNQLLTEVDGIVSRGARRGLRSTEMAKEIRARFAVTKNRAKLIARDQTAKLNGQITQARQTAVGVKSYIWRTSQDERVRDEHAAREGNEFKWNQPPSDGHPGEPINCRCTAEPVLTDLLAAL